MGAFHGTHVHTADAAVPPLDADLADLLDRGLGGVHAGIDLFRQGARLLMLERLTLDETTTILATLCGDADGRDVTALLGALVGRLTDPDTNPCLRDLDDARRADVQRIGEWFGRELDHAAPRDLGAAAAARTDPYADLADLEPLPPVGVFGPA